MFSEIAPRSFFHQENLEKVKNPVGGCTMAVPFRPIRFSTFLNRNQLLKSQISLSNHIAPSKITDHLLKSQIAFFR